MYLQLMSKYKYGVSTTTSFTSSGAAVLDGYYPVDGSDDETPVIDTFDVWLNGTAAENRAKLTEIRLALESAKKFWNTARQAYLYYDVDESSVWWRSPIKSGRAVHNPRLLHEINRARMRITIIVERAPWWEKADLVDIPLTNGNGTDVTTGLRVYNCGDHAVVDTSYYRDNYAEIDGVNDVAGDLPAPLYLRYTNLALSLAVNIRTIHAWNNIHCDPENYTGLIEAEAYGSDTSLTGASAGYVGDFSIPDSAETMFWYLDVDDYVRYAGTSYFILAMRLKYNEITDLGNLKLKVELYESTMGSLFMSDWFYPVAGTGYPVLVISPPFLLAPMEIATYIDDLLGYLLRIYAYQESGSTITLTADDFYLLPVDEYRKIGTETKNFDVGVTTIQYLVDDQPSMCLYEHYIPDSVVGKIRQDKIGRIFVHPGIPQRITWIYGMTTATTQTQINSAYFQVVLSYRPRRRTI